MSKRVGKIASDAVQKRTQTPLMSWIRNKLLASLGRSDVAGLPTADGKSEFQFPHRYPSTQASRAIEMPKLPGGIHHRLSDVYYYERDGRRQVVPPMEVYKADSDGQKFLEAFEQAETPARKSESENFGLSWSMPTPGVGCEWERNLDGERDSQRNSYELRQVEKYDKYSRT
ncbi:unnamed protein product [Bursaphelenchus okinawaensis]|uniref:NADH dehydrogenase [ubiquinone] 1 alpha subcomplex subunit 7 n=1 Tax=Bursaphelenchus okinawaensis TaxID=465554 RepID=A0A811K8X6_9BILA|nr:unnamed protein product [Bursaphelenchus okinawaensis]CAG9096329.1 unnamed protein product [Bursaphelenchus okinawaensis]